MPKRQPKQQTPQIDLSFVNAATLLLPPADQWHFLLIGCGGTGSWLAPSIARLCRVLGEQGKSAEAIFIDHDRLEQKNIPRQNFCEAELGQPKASALAARYSAAWGVKITARVEPFKQAHLREYEWRNQNLILIGAVDNAAARQEIAKSLKGNTADVPHTAWWLDCGNSESSGQVILGSAPDAKELRGAFLSRKICRALPAPTLVAPDLLEPRPEESRKNKISCAEIQMANNQSLAVNQAVAAIASDYLSRLVSGGLKKFATYFDLESGSARSRYIVPEEIAGMAKKPVEFVLAK
ncbi:MAG TPA: ThiF family adenylyltransferase [Blastocatellia bacterium]|nr:ThiF family adenylyltransferase [Blastocatellia bacterium]